MKSSVMTGETLMPDTELMHRHCQKIYECCAAFANDCRALPDPPNGMKVVFGITVLLGYAVKLTAEKMAVDGHIADVEGQMLAFIQDHVSNDLHEQIEPDEKLRRDLVRAVSGARLNGVDQFDIVSALMDRATGMAVPSEGGKMQ